MPSFRYAIRSQRCLIIASAFYEGPEKEKLSKPYLCYLRERRPFAFAGIWNEWQNPQTGAITNTCAIITTVANQLLQKVGHHRSPVILHKRDERVWLGQNTSLAKVTALLEPHPTELMNAYPVAPTVKNPKASGKELLQPIGERLIDESDIRITEKWNNGGMMKNTTGDTTPGEW
jgi:putative SOS response-associated peptidase YedK